MLWYWCCQRCCYGIGVVREIQVLNVLLSELNNRKSVQICLAFKICFSVVWFSYVEPEATLLPSHFIYYAIVKNKNLLCSMFIHAKFSILKFD